jgi:hypothetical protein
LASAGTGAILAGDVITFAGDARQYVVTIGDGDVSGGGTITLGGNGLRAALAGSTVAITMVASAVKNIAFHKAAVEIGVRALAQPLGGDAAVDRLTVQDPESGLIYNIAAYKGYNKAMFDISVLYGYKVWKPEFTAALLG